MKFLIVNDDGIEAPGIAALQRAAAQLGSPTVVAPAEHHSGCGHQATTTRPLALRCTAPGWHAIDGTPADCTRLGLLHVAPDSQWVLSGINDGANLGVDIYMSGTVAAVREAALLGRPAVAFSQYRRAHQAIDWQLSTEMTLAVMRRLFEETLPPGCYWNVNFPALPSGSPVPPVVLCKPDLNPLPLRYDQRDGGFHYQADYHQRPRGRGSDVEACFAGNITISQVALGSDH